MRRRRLAATANPDGLHVPHLTFGVQPRQRFIFIDRQNRGYATRIAKLTNDELIRAHHALLLVIHDGGHDDHDLRCLLSKLSRAAAELAKRLANATGVPAVIHDVEPHPVWREHHEHAPGEHERPRS